LLTQASQHPGADLTNSSWFLVEFFSDFGRAPLSSKDTDGDGRLSMSEIEKMIIKPHGADLDGDGFITVQEYAAFRANK